MNVADSFLADITEHPDDDAPRFIFADWLDEHGDPTRAEFIRLQIEIARLPRNDPRSRALRKRETQLLDPNRKRWNPLPDGVVSSSGYERGFIADISINIATFLERGVSLCRLAPLQHIHFHSGSSCVSQAMLQRLSNSKLLSQMRTLGLGGQNVVDGGLIALFRSSRMQGLRRINLYSNRVGNAGIEALADCPHLTQLATLQLDKNRLDADGVKALAASRHLTSLESLALGENAVGRSAAEELAASPILSRLWLLSLSRADLGQAGAMALACSPHLTGLEWLKLDDNGLGPAIGPVLLERMPGLSYLDLSSNGLGDEGAMAIAECPEAAHLKELDLGATGIGQEGGLALARSPYLEACELRLWDNPLTGARKALRKRFGSHVGLN